MKHPKCFLLRFYQLIELRHFSPVQQHKRDFLYKESPAYVAGLEKNDVILSIDKNEVKSILDVSKFITMSTSEFIDFKVSRYDKEVLIKVKLLKHV